MLSKYRKLWVFGDSYSTPNYYVSPRESFWGLTAQHLKVDSIENVSWLGNSFDSVCHTLICLQQEIDWVNDFVLVGMPPLERFTVFDNFKDSVTHSTIIETQSWHLEKKDLTCHRGLENLSIKDIKDLVLLQDRSWLETQILRSLFLLTHWLDSKTNNYLIINLSKPMDIDNRWGPSEFLLEYTINHPRCMIFKDTYYSVNLDINKPEDFHRYGWMGHHGAAGNQNYFKQTIKPRLC